MFYLTRKIVSNPHFRLVQKDLESTGNKATVQIGGKDVLGIGSTMIKKNIVVGEEGWSDLTRDDGQASPKDLKWTGKKIAEIAGEGEP